MDFKYKTYDDSYLFLQESDKNNRNLIDFIINAERIDKNNPAFRSLIEDVKRMQSSSILHTVLMMDKVELCIHKVELPRSFKVFEAKDIKQGKDAPRKVFIDVTGLISFKDGYFYCKKIDSLISYLFAALGYLLYREAPFKVVNNSSISISATECFVSMFDYILDYLRIIGYSQNKTRISYLAALYFQHHMLSKDIDTYTKNIAAKTAGIATADTKAFELYYEEKDFDNIFNFVYMIAENFKLKGLTPEVFIHKWMYLYGTGTQYGCELFTAFSAILTHAYCGAYVLNQKQIERCCGKSMVSYAVSLLKVGVDEFDKRGYMEQSALDDLTPRDKNTINLAEAFLKRNKIPEDCKFVKEDYASKSRAKERSNKLIAYYRSVEQEHKISEKMKNVAFGAMGAMGQFNIKGTENVYEAGVLEVVLKAAKSYFNERDKRILYNEINASCNQISDYIKSEVKDKEKAQRFAKSLIELRKCLAYV